ncbi:tetratricopeptide repeat protein [Aliikangiella maris]|uniref:Tetratricopeptide repeat protein n=2 Tax=Aliikangiella maris TaxID=3162458 RepID=A0ABV3MUA5_9GAMM
MENLELDNIQPDNHKPADIMLEQVETNIKYGAYRKALSLAQSSWGDFQTWRTPQQLLKLIVILNKLGRPRAADFLRLKLWRQNPGNSELAVNAAYSLIYRQGPDAMWNLANQHLQSEQLNHELRAEWLLFKSQICARMKDFEQAKYFYEQSTQYAQNLWSERVAGYLLIEQEEYEQAYQFMAALYQQYPYEKVLLQLIQTMDYVDENNAQRILLLEQEKDKFESVSLLFALAFEYKVAGLWAPLINVIAEIEQLKLGDEKLIDEKLAYLKGSAALGQENFEDAVAYFKKNTSSFCQTIANNIEQCQQPKTKKIDVPFLKQKSMTCAPASMAAILKFHGYDFEQSEIAEQICYDGTPDYLERKWLNDNAIPFREFDLTETSAIELLDHDLPFALVTGYASINHMQVVKGYDIRKGILYLMDPADANCTEVLFKEVIAANQVTGPRCLVFASEEKLANIQHMSLKSENIYLLSDKYHTALRAHQLTQAAKILDELNSAYPDERLTLLAQGAMANYYNREQEYFEVYQKLDEKFPDVSWIVSSRYYAYFSLGQRNNGIEYLLEKVDKNLNAELTETLFLEIYDDSRYQDRIKPIINKIQRYALSSAESNWLLGHYYSNQNDLETAARLYRWALSLDDKNEKYSESFFKSYRLIGKEQEALQLLNARWDVFQKKSNGPAISLYYALESLDREQEGLQVITQSLSHLPEDKKLIYFYLSKLLAVSELDKFKTEFERIGNKLSSSEQLALNGRYYQNIDEAEKALNCFHQLIKNDEQSLYYYHDLFRLMKNLGQDSEIDNILVKLEAELGLTRNLCSLIIDWTADEHKKYVYLKKYIDEHPYEINRIGQLVKEYLTNYQLDDAQQVLDNALSVKPNDCTLLYLSAEVALKKNQMTQAKALAWSAIGSDIDSDEAFDILVRTHIGADERYQMLMDFVSLIHQSTTFGDSMWNFWFAAQAWVSQEEILQICESFFERKTDSWYSWVLLAKQYVTLEKLDKALSLIEQASDKFPLVPRVYLEKGEIYLLQGQTTKAIEAFQQALKLNPAWSYLSRRLSEIYESNGRDELAIKVLEKAGRFDSEDGITWGLLADIYYRRGNIEEAVTYLKKAVRLEIDYPWAWDKLADWGKEISQDELALNVAKQLTDRYPLSPTCWLYNARTQTDAAAAIASFEKGLQLEPLHVGLNRDYILFLIEQKQYDAAAFLIEEKKWCNDPPVTIQILKADIFHAQAKYGEALEFLKSWLEKHQYISFGWQKLLRWSENFHQVKTTVEAAHHLVKLEPNNAYLLSLCSDMLLKYGEKMDQQKAYELAEKAFLIEPNNPFIAYTWIDMLLHHKDFIKLEKVEQITYRLITDPLLDIRKMMRLIMQQQYDETLTIWESVLQANVDNYWIYNQAFNITEDKNIRIKLFEKLNDFIENNTACIAIYRKWANVILQQNSDDKKVIEYLTGRIDDDCWHVICGEYLDFLIQHRKKIAKEIYVNYHDKIRSHDELFGSMGYLLQLTESEKEVIKWYESRTLDSHLPAYAVYHYQWVLMYIGDWQKAQTVNQVLLTCEPDHSYSNACLWAGLFKVVNTGICEKNDLINIDWDELVEIEQYVCCLLEAFYYKQGRPLFESTSQVSASLRRAQDHFPPVEKSPIAIAVKQKVKSILSEEIQDYGFFTRLRLKFWLYLRF